MRNVDGETLCDELNPLHPVTNPVRMVLRQIKVILRFGFTVA